MARAVVHKTRGKLDLRSLTVFGLNSKPATDTPIGYFGTGLKYAVAVLARNNIPVTFWIDGKKWTVEQDDTKFRDKQFKSLFLKRHTLIPKTINLPFTTELGKNWEIWQAFRELESNTRDELGITFIADNLTPGYALGYTLIEVNDDKYVQCYYDKDQYFLPDGLTARDGNDRIQVFARKSNAVYYRSIKVLDLKEPSENTYNILTGIQLTEDRTVSEWSANYEIQQYLAQSQDREVVRRAISAPHKTHERKFDYEYSSRSELFLDTVDEVGDAATDYAKSILRRDRPPEEPKTSYANWIRDLIAAIERSDFDRVEEVTRENKEEVLDILRISAQAKEKEEHNNGQGNERDTPIIEMVGRDSREARDSYASEQSNDTRKEADEIPF